MSRPSVLLSFVLAIATLATPALTQGEVKWFVLRNHEVENCWTATLVRVDGQYINTFDQKAGGPYATEEEALERLRALEEKGICQQK